MKNQFLKELKWRGLIHDVTPEIEKYLDKRDAYAYIGFDPTSSSFHIGNLVQLIILIHFKKYGYNPIALIGGATGMIGDPSGKSKERVLLDSDTIKENVISLKKQLNKFFLATNKTKSDCLVLNNLSWIDKFSFIEFCRDIGKHISVNYMMSKDSVKNRIKSDSNSGMSFTEFTYQLFQAFDFFYLSKKFNCLLQIGGSDQWGNITTGIELIRRKSGVNAHALTCPLITKSDGKKFGKTESGNIWLDKNKTSTYKFYQYWLNISDEDAFNYIKIFTFLEKDLIENLIANHKKDPHLRIVQKKLAEEVTIMVHSQEELDNAKLASKILFGSSTFEDLKKIKKEFFIEIFNGVPQFEISLDKVSSGLKIIEALTLNSIFLKSNAEARRLLVQNSISINKNKVDQNYIISDQDIVNDCILIQKGKKNYFLLKVI
ncbi:MAG: tyrosine--tRNA ligase [Bacteroidota bacterium]|nr:tyrosine--tRNA ligase [Bacteroidota bacterium]MEC8614920.1 tyrosine--tRNA ligase [Bacteroidota bacterium]|tara:strand:- start:1044 stop:2336 length:1293 start_codon:yes stop_codon:yes gene_type:complete